MCAYQKRRPGARLPVYVAHDTDAAGSRWQDIRRPSLRDLPGELYRLLSTTFSGQDWVPIPQPLPHSEFFFGSD
jgi:hypothetical protein